MTLSSMLVLSALIALSWIEIAFGADCQVPGNLVQNCGFDAGLDGYQSVGSGQFTGVRNAADFGNSDGNAVYMGSTTGSDNEYIQTLSLIPFATYQISFKVAFGTANDASLFATVSFDGQEVFSFKGAGSPVGTELTPSAGQPQIAETYVFYPRTYTVTVSDVDTAHLNFDFGGRSVPSYVYFDSFKVVLVSGPPTHSSSTGGGGSVVGDPQFSGFLGQEFQVHGSSGNVYNIISSKHMQYNALFTFLEQGKCRVGTDCFSHPGNYFGSVGVMINTNDNDDSVKQQLTIEAGSVDQGMTIMLGNRTLTPSSDNRMKLSTKANLFFPSAFECYIESADFTIKLENSDMFLNQRVSINQELLDEIKSVQSSPASDESEQMQQMPHGILGQTWRMKQYDNRWKFIQGTLSEYIVADGLLGSMFKHNRFA